MITLGFDTSAEEGSVAIVNNGELAGQKIIDTGRDHAAGLLPALNELLQSSRIGVSQVELLAVGTGPGSYTGCRVGIAFARGLAFALGKPLIGVCSLEAIAYRVRDFNGTIMVMVDAKMRACYHAAYRWVGDRFEVWREPGVSPLEEINLGDTEETLLVGPDNIRLHEKFAEFFGDGVEIPEKAFFPDAAYIALRAEKDMLAGDFEPNKPVLPSYLRPAPAELKLKEKK